MGRAKAAYVTLSFNVRRDQADWLRGLEGLNMSGFMRQLLDYARENLEKVSDFRIIGGTKGPGMSL